MLGHKLRGRLLMIGGRRKNRKYFFLKGSGWKRLVFAHPFLLNRGALIASANFIFSWGRPLNFFFPGEGFLKIFFLGEGPLFFFLDFLRALPQIINGPPLSLFVYYLSITTLPETQYFFFPNLHTSNI